MKIPSPRECGLPPKFERWDPGQEEGLRFLLTSQKRVKVMAAPTGFGKSPVYVAFALLTKLPTCIVTENRGLQDQLIEDFGPIGMVDIRGRRNYVCDLKEDFTCEDGYKAQCPYKGTIGCPSSQAEMRASISYLVVTNYDKWTAAKKYGQGMNHFQQVIFDEGHAAPAALERAMQVTLGFREMSEHIHLPIPEGPELQEFAAWKNWASVARGEAQARLQAAEDYLKFHRDASPGRIRHALHMRNLVRRLGVLATARPTSWVLEEQEKGMQFDPIRAGRYSESMLLLKVPSIVVVSATVRPKTLFMIGVGREQFDYKEFDSNFNPAQCPIYWMPTQQIDSKHPDQDKVLLRVDQVLAKRQDRKGIIHTISYARRELMRGLRFWPKMLLNPKGEPPTEMVDHFKLAGPGAILVSPSVGTGYDFPGKDCEWQIIWKVPFPPPSKILKARTAEDAEYPHYLAATQLTQIIGRGARRKTDWCENFIFDDNIGWFLGKYKHLFPRSFHGFFRKVSVLPQPPPPMP